MSIPHFWDLDALFSVGETWVKYFATVCITVVYKRLLLPV